MQPTEPVSNPPTNHAENDELSTTNRAATKPSRVPRTTTIERDKKLIKFFTSQVVKYGPERAISLTAKKFKVPERTVERALNNP